LAWQDSEHDERGKQARFNTWFRSFFFFRHYVFTRADHVDGSSVERVLDMHQVMFLDRSDARATGF
jgi:hypothetical protein